MDCTWKYVIQRAKLFDVPQSLKFGCIDKVPIILGELDLMVHHILDVSALPEYIRMCLSLALRDEVSICN